MFPSCAKLRTDDLSVPCLKVPSKRDSSIAIFGIGTDSTHLPASTLQNLITPSECNVTIYSVFSPVDNTSISSTAADADLLLPGVRDSALLTALLTFLVQKEKS